MTGTKNLSAVDFSSQKGVNLTDGTAPTDAATKGQLDSTSTADRSRANHTGSQAAATILDFDTQVRTSRLDQLVAPSGTLNLNSQRISALLDPSAPQDSATKAYVDAQLAATASGLVLKGSVRAATTTNLTIAAPGTTVDGLTMANGELVILAGQSTGSQNGPWIFNGSAAALTRPPNFDTTAKAVLGSFWDVREGTYADSFALMSNDSTVTLGTTALTFVFRGLASPTTGYNATCPSTSAGGSWVVTHNLGSRAVQAQVARVGSPYDFVNVRIERTTTNTVTVLPDVALSAGEFEIMVGRVA